MDNPQQISGLPEGATLDPVTPITPTQQPQQSATPITPTQQSQQIVGLPEGATLDPATTDTTDTTATQSTTATQPFSAKGFAPIHIDENASRDKGMLGTLEGNLLNEGKAVSAVGAGIGDSLLSSMNGIASIAHLPHATLQARQQELEQQNRENPALNATGNVIENLLEFYSGDSALKGLTKSAQLAKSAKFAKLLEESPKLAQALDWGLKTMGQTALRSGVVAGAQGTLGAEAQGDDLPTSLEKGAVSGVAGGALSAVGEAIPALWRGAKGGPAIQKVFQQGIRSILDDAAEKAGIDAADVKPSTSIRDAAGNLADAIKKRGSAAFQTLDDATGGRFQRFEDSLKNVNDRLNTSVGADEEESQELLAEKARIEKAQEKAFAEAKAKGVDPATVANARADWRQAHALSDLDRQIKMATSGIRPELKEPNGTEEVLDPGKAFLRLTRLFDSGRLQDALGPDQAAALMQHTDQAYLANARSLALRRTAKIARRVGVYGVAPAVGGGAVVGAIRHNLFGLGDH